MTNKPIIGIMPLWDGEKQILWMYPEYMNCIETAGGIPVMLPLTTDRETCEKFFNICDGFLFTGGQDVDPKIYGEDMLFDNVKCCRKRDETESIYLSLALKHDKPILGICRGMQFINAFLKGTLYQDIPSQFPSDIHHRQKEPYGSPSHSVSLVQDSPLYRLLKKTHLDVNSIHHQGIKDLCPGGKPMAYSPDGICEAFYIPEKKFVRGVQWHPEYLFENDPDSVKIVREFVSNC